MINFEVIVFQIRLFEILVHVLKGIEKDKIRQKIEILVHVLKRIKRKKIVLHQKNEILVHVLKEIK